MNDVDDNKIFWLLLWMIGVPVSLFLSFMMFCLALATWHDVMHYIGTP